MKKKKDLSKTLFDEPNKPMGGKTKGCLIILLIFMLVGGIIGTVAYKGMKGAAEKARPRNTKFDLTLLVTIIKSEEKNCMNDSKYLINELVLCEERTPEKIIKALIKTLDTNNTIDSSTIPNKKIIVYSQNAYFPGKKTLRISKINISDEDVGYINLSTSGSDIIIKACIKTPCKNEENRKQSTVRIK